MRDMTRDQMQDQLPDLLHSRLSADDAAALERAVAADPELAAELALLRAVSASHARTPVVNVSRIVAALPAAPAHAVAPAVDDLAARRAVRRPMISYRFARAAALLVVVGGGTLVSVYNTRSHSANEGAPVVQAESVAVGGGAMQLGLGTSTDDLSVEQLRALEADIRSLDGIPSAESDSDADFLAGEGA